MTKTRNAFRIEHVEEGEAVDFAVFKLLQDGSRHYVLMGDTHRSAIKTWRSFNGAHKNAQLVVSRLPNAESRKLGNGSNPVVAVCVVRDPFHGNPMVYVVWSCEGGPREAVVYERSAWKFKQDENGDWGIV